MGIRKVSLLPVLFHLAGKPLKTLLIPGGADSSRFEMYNVQHYTDWESIKHFTNMGAAY